MEAGLNFPQFHSHRPLARHFSDNVLKGTLGVSLAAGLKSGLFNHQETVPFWRSLI